MTDEKPIEKEVAKVALNAGGLRPSLLSAKADAMWAKSKLNFEASGAAVAMGSVKLKTKTFSDIAKQNSEQQQKEKEASENRPKFIFGQNIAARVIQNGVPLAAAEETTNGPKKAEDLFRDAASNGGENGIVAKSYEEFKKEAAEAAAKQKEQQEKQIPTTSLIDVKTGEEEDFLVFQTACKLHVFDTQQKRYVEKGMSTVKISKRFDEDGEHHRIIARTTGIHRLVINSKIFPDMLLERVDQKRLKISAMGVEPPSIQVYLVTIGFTNSDLSIEGLCSTLQELIHRSQEENKSRKRKPSSGLDEVEAKKGATAVEDGETKAEEEEEAKVVETEAVEEEAEESAPAASEESDVEKREEEAEKKEEKVEKKEAEVAEEKEEKSEEPAAV